MQKANKSNFIIGIPVIILLVLLNIFSFLILFNKPNTAHIASYTYVPDPNNSLQGEKNSLQLGTFKLIPNQTGNDCNSNQLIGTSESSVAWAISPDPGQSVGAGGKVKLWYNDEHALTLGKGSISDISQDHVLNPNVGDETARDANNFPYFPALFLTDITTNSSNTDGDAEHGGTPHKPDEIWGGWKALGTYTEPPQNNSVLPSGADPFPATSNLKFQNDKIAHGARGTSYGAEIIWNVDNLGLTSGHTYRAEFIVHDGDRDGDIGQGCTTISL